MKIVLTGTGTSQGIPVIGCRCEVCRSPDPKDKRLRTAAFIQYHDSHLAIDAGPDFRQQMLDLDIDHLDALVITHEHNDHVAGLDDIRPFNFKQGRPLKVYALPRVAQDIRRRFAYIFSEHPYPGAPQIDLIDIKPYELYRVGDINFTPFMVKHGDIDIVGVHCRGSLCKGMLYYRCQSNPSGVRKISPVQRNLDPECPASPQTSFSLQPAGGHRFSAPV